MRQIDVSVHGLVQRGRDARLAIRNALSIGDAPNGEIHRCPGRFVRERHIHQIIS
jgi:hypothetical protein